MDIVGYIRSTPFVDLILLGLLAVAVILGVLQGAIRGLVSIGAIILAFLVAANLRDPLGHFLDTYWTQFSLDYNRMLAFGLVFVILTCVAIGTVLGFTHRTEIRPQQPVVDDILGGFLGLIEGLMLLLVVVVILGSYSQSPSSPNAPVKEEIAQITQLKEMLVDQSHLGGALHSNIAPGFVHILGSLLPSDLVSEFP